MAKNLQVNLAFTADTSAAMQNLQTLRTSLTEISSMPFSMGKNISQDLKIAANSAASLQKHLGAAMDVKTGNLNLSKLESSLKSSNQSLSSLTSGLLKAGVSGEKAFMATYSAIAQSNLQLKKSNTLAAQFATTLKNTAKWQLSSTLLHGLISGFNSAINYAKDLNESLNNIQIVTQQSSDQMAEFAKQANKAAKELRTTTTAYTDAALIYYQQGLTGDAVKQRTDTTVKMANVTGESAQTVSQWMTAVWNNFDDGSKKLEYYADVMTALGAATASSSDEIAQGLEKFSAVADTVGLSYEYATSALATVTAQTRQSADVVGTAFKTLFARIQDLELGNTLDDGTTLGKYSEALAKVGVNIKDASGNLKDMDIVLDEMGAKWNALDKDQQVALAKSVAGIRQYTQLIALMDNYDTFKVNLDVVNAAEGTLEEQAEIYEQSWEAASKNVKASLESMYNVLIPTDFIVDFTNGLADVVSGFTKVLDAAGGLRTILLLISSIVLSKFQASIATSLNSGIEKVQTLINSAKETGNVFTLVGNKIKESFVNSAKAGVVQVEQQSNKAATGIQAQSQEGLNQALNQKDASGKAIALSEGFVSQIKSLQQIETYNTKILNLKNQMTTSEFESFQMEQQQLKVLGEQIASKKQQISDLELEKQHLVEIQNLESARVRTYNTSDGRIGTSDTSGILKTNQSLGYDETLGYTMGAQLADQYSGKDVKTNFETDKTTGESVGAMSFANEEAMLQAKTQILQVVSDTAAIESEIGAILDDSVMSEEQKAQAIEKVVAQKKDEGALTKEAADAIKSNITATRDVNGNITKAVISTGKLKNTMTSLSTGVQKAAAHLGISKEHINKIVLLSRQQKKAQGEVNQLQGQSKQITERIEEGLNKIVERAGSIGTVLVKGVQGFSQMAMGISMLQSAVNSLGEAFKDGEFSFSTFLSGLTSLGMGLPILINGFKGLMTAVASTTTVQNVANATMAAQLVASKLYTEAKGEEAAAVLTEAGAEKIAAVATATNISADKIKLALSELMKGAKLSEALATAGLTSAEWAQVAANLGLQASMAPVLLITLGIVAAFAALVGIIYAFVKASEAAKAASPEGRLQALEEASNRSAEALEKTKEQVKQLQTTLEGLKDSYKNIENLKKGTVEWLVAVTEVNQQVESLIKQFPELQDKVDYSKGYAYLSEEGLNEALQLSNQKLTVSANIDKTSQINYKSEKLNQLEDEWGGQQATGKMTEDGEYSEYKWVKANFFDQVAVQEKILELAEREQKFGLEKNKLVNEYIEDLKEAKSLQEEIKQLEEAQMSTRIQSLGSTRSIEEFNEVVDVDKVEKEVQEKTKSFNEENWNKHTNYTKDSEEYDMIEDFMKTQGAEVEYVAQREGKMVLKIDDKEVEYTRQEVEDALTELYTNEELKNKLKEGLTETLSKSLDIKSLNLEGLDLNTLNIIDDFKREFDKGFENTEFKGKTDELFKAVASSYERAYGGIKSGMEAFSQETQYIDKTSTAFKNLNENIDPTKIDEYINSLRELNADGQIDSMTSFFSSSAEEMGLDEAAAESMQEYAKSLTDAAENSDDLSNSLKYNANAAAKVAVAITKMDKGIDVLAENYENWSDVLKNSSKSTREYSDALSGIKTALSDVLGASEDFISEDFIQEHLEEIEQAATGSEDAITELQAELSKDILCQIVGVSDFSDLDSDMQNMQNKIQDLSKDIQIGAQLDKGEFLKSANELVKETNMTVDEAQAYFNSLGYEPEFVTEEQTVTRSIPQEQTHTDYKITTGTIDILGQEFPIPTIDRLTTTSISGYKDLEEIIQVPALSADGTPKIKSITRSGSGGKLGNYSSSGGGGKSPGSSGGSSSSSKTARKSKKKTADEKDWYHDINREIEELERSTDRLADAKDRAFGDDRIAKIKEETEAINNQIDAQKRLSNQATKAMDNDKDKLKKYGVKFDKKTDEITNYDAVVKQEVKTYNNAVDTYNAAAAQKDAGNLSDEAWEAAQEAFDEAEERYNGLFDAIDSYEGNLDIKINADEKQKELIQEGIDKILEDIDYSVEVAVEVNEDGIENLERLLKFLDDDLTDGVERVTNMTKQMGKTFENIDFYKAGIEQTLATAGASDKQIAKYMAGDANALKGLDLTDDQLEQIQNYTDGIEECEDKLLELRDSIESQVMTTFDAWHEKIEKNNEAFDHGITMMETYKTMVDTVGQGWMGVNEETLREMEEVTMSAAQGKVLNTKAQVETTQSAIVTAQTKLKLAKDNKDSKSIKMWQDTLDELNSQLLEDQEAFTQAWADSLTTAADIFQAQMERTFDELEVDLAGSFKTLEQLQNAYNQDMTAAERYLDGGEKLYQLSKLNRQIQKDIDSSTSSKAQKEMAELQEIINGYQQDGVQMSQYELDALQKKYDLKLAEIALEEAQNAKSKVQMQRNASGGFSYVYTADENNIADAQQKYEDALEASRQLGEDQSKELTQAIIQNRQDMVAAMKEINIADYASQEEYLTAVTEATKFYKEQEAFYIEEYNKTVARSQLTYAQDFADYESWSGKKLETSALLTEKLGDDQNVLGENTYGFVENYGAYMQEMVGDMDLPIVAAQDLNNALGTGTGDGDTGLYNSMLASAAAWVTGMGASSQEAAGSFNLLINDGKGGGIVGVIATLGDGTSEGYYKDAIGNVISFIGKKDANGTFVGELSKGGKGFTEISTSASNLLTELGAVTGKGSGKYSKLIASGSSFAEEFNGKIGNIEFSPVSTKADDLITALGDPDKKESTFGKIAANASLWEKNMKKTLSKAGVDVTNFGTGAKTDLGEGSDAQTAFSGFTTAVHNAMYGENGTKKDPKGGVVGGIKSARAAISKLKKGAKKNFDKTATAVSDWQKTYSKKLGKAKTSTTNLKNAINNLKSKKIKITVNGLTDGKKKKIDDIRKAVEKLKDKSITITTNYVNNYKTNGTDKSGSGDSGGKPTWERVYAAYQKINSGAWGNGIDNRITKGKKDGYTESEVRYAQGYIDYVYPPTLGGLGKDPAEAKRLLGYDTGGYTGEWGAEGRLALLHQKEIVLNKSDTENFLEAIKLVRKIANQIDLQAALMGQEIVISSLSSIKPGASNALDQNVTIHAEFPNVSQHSEIEQAFENLVNKAAQFAQRK